MKSGIVILIVVVIVIIIVAVVVFLIQRKNGLGWACENTLTQSERLRLGVTGAPRTGRCIQTTGSGEGTFSTKAECDNSSVCTVSQKFACNGVGQDCVEDPNGTYVTHPTADGGDTAQVLAECKSQCNLPVIPSGTYIIRTLVGSRVLLKYFSSFLYAAPPAQQEGTQIIYDSALGTLYVNSSDTPGFLSNKTGKTGPDPDSPDYPLIVSTAGTDEKGWILDTVSNPSRIEPTFEIIGKVGKLLFVDNGQILPLLFTSFDTVSLDSQFYLNTTLARGWKCEGV